MSWVAPSPGSLAAFLVVVVGVVIAVAGGLRLAGFAPLRIAGGLGAWLALTGLLSASGVLAESVGPIPLVFPFLLGSNLMALGLALSRVGRALTAAVPLAALVAFQAFRLPLEVVLHAWYGEGVIPVQMTWEGANFDIVTGSLAVPMALVLAKRPSRMLAWIFDGMGLVLLVNVVRVALRVTPGPFFAYDDDTAPLLLAFHFPTGWIVSVCVAGALAGHVVLTRALLLPSRANPALPWMRQDGADPEKAQPAAAASSG
jgi:hypothetical protein